MMLLEMGAWAEKSDTGGKYEEIVEMKGMEVIIKNHMHDMEEK